MTLGGAGDAVGEVHAGVEPLRAVRRGDLAGEHVDHLIVKGLSVVGGIEVVELLSPVSPASGEAVENLAGICFALFLRGDYGCVFTGVIGAADFAWREARFPEVLLGKDIGCYLAPTGGDHDVFHEEDG